MYHWYRTLNTFCRWLLVTGAIEHNPLTGVSMRTPTTLPGVPTEDELQAVLACCPVTLEDVRSGKGQKDRVSFVGATTTRALRNYLALRPLVGREDWLFGGGRRRPLTPRHLVQILHRLSTRAGLPPNRRLHPHALRHLAATSWLRSGMGLDQVRRLLGHASLNMTLRYSNLVGADLQRAHKDARAIERMGLDATQRPGQRGRRGR